MENNNTEPTTSERPMSCTRRAIQKPYDKTDSKPSWSDDGGVDVKKSKRVRNISIVVVILGILLAVGFFVTRSSDKEVVEVENPPEEVVVEEVEAEEVEQLEREDITLEILNGTGIAGLAGDTAEIFEDLGYTVKEVGNADNTTKNELYVDPEFAEMVEILLEDVDTELDITSIAGGLDDSSTTARIVLGSDEEDVDVEITTEDAEEELTPTEAQAEEEPTSTPEPTPTGGESAE